MAGEGKNSDLKAGFDPGDAKAKTNLVKDIVAMANSGGGQFIFGGDETSSPGLSPKTAKALDSAKILDYVEKYVEKGYVHLRHDVQPGAGDKVVLTIAVEPADYPVVMRKDGTWADMRNSSPVFYRGDMWVRHGSKTERLSQADMRRFIDEAFRRGLDQVLSAAQIVRQAGPASSLEFRTETGDVIRNPNDLLNLALSRRTLNLPSLLHGKELLWLFILRGSFHSSTEQLELIIESALRRPPTLYWWLTDPRVDPAMMKDILTRVPDSEDRDKSDAASSTVELAAIYLEDADLEQLLRDFKKSRYAHFRREAGQFNSRSAAKQSLLRRIKRQKIEGHKLAELDVHELERQASDVADQAFGEPSVGASRRLADVTRTIWAKETDLIG